MIQVAEDQSHFCEVKLEELLVKNTFFECEKRESMNLSIFLRIYFIFFEDACQPCPGSFRAVGWIIGEAECPLNELYESVILMVLIKGHYQ